MRPDPRLTPGAALDVTAADVCVPGYARRVRRVPLAVWRAAYARYGIRAHAPGSYEVDHLISLELGGSNALANLWPEPMDGLGGWNARTKDVLENRLHALVCRGAVDLGTAQRAIAADWVGAYRRYVGPSPAAAGDWRTELRAAPHPRWPW